MRSLLRWSLLAAVAALLDQLSKAAVISWMGDRHLVRINDFFDLVLAHNQGAAFSFLADAGGWQRSFFSVIALAAIVFIGILIFRHPSQPRFCFGLTLIMGGALGNLIDRMRWGTVTDFIQWHVAQHYWPAFNLADSAITLGVVVLLWDGLKARK
ncbi:MAG: lipoprotein signal peptidase [Betaproteobacteria bacterium]|nr:lipoprotein signal peptidase [Betaproteobacteria bacterium]MDE2131198.1 lipoprotein signal peptidase [Betaproteobacteria bacterium]MDE2211196.1 lipoprotein signal peptidase [Betaproteobacteria bacterium]